MQRFTFVLIPLFLILLAACAPQAEPQEQIETIVAGALTQTAASVSTTLQVTPSSLPVISGSQAIYFSPILGFQISYPTDWHLQEAADAQPPAVSVTSFDPANAPHKLEWTAQTISMQFRLLPAGSVPQTLEAWVETAKQAAVDTQLSLFEEEQLSIANQPAARLTLVSGSGGIIHQVLTILDGRSYEITIEGNLDLGKSLLSTLQPYAPGGLKPYESDAPAAGICQEPQGDQVEIVLGSDQSGMPLAGRCVVVKPSQRLVLINQTDGPFGTMFADINIDMPLGSTVLLDRPVAEYLAPGVHSLPNGPELWLKQDAPVPVATMPDPLRNYENSTIGIALTLLPGWEVDEQGLSNLNQEVIFIPGDAEPFIAYLTVSLETRTLEQITTQYAQNAPDALREDIVFNGQPTVKYVYSFGRQEVFVPSGDRLYMLSTDKPANEEVQWMLASFTFLDS